MTPHTDQAVAQSLADMVSQRVRLSGFYSAPAAQALYNSSPEEFDAEQVGVDAKGRGVYVMFWRPPRTAQS